MKVAKPNQVTSWTFEMINPAGDTVTLGPHPTIYQLVNQVMSYIGVYDGMTENKYSAQLTEQANKVSDGNLEKYVKLLVEHQTCIRLKGKIDCWSGGVGDDVHEFISKVEGFVLEKAPAPIVGIVRRFAKAVTKGKSSTFTACSSCGGTAVMDAKVNNLGRAGALNSFFKKK